jgi:hypothetical protein
MVQGCALPGVRGAQPRIWIFCTGTVKPAKVLALSLEHLNGC